MFLIFDLFLLPQTRITFCDFIIPQHPHYREHAMVLKLLLGLHVHFFQFKGLNFRVLCWLTDTCCELHSITSALNQTTVGSCSVNHLERARGEQHCVVWLQNFSAVISTKLCFGQTSQSLSFIGQCSFLFLWGLLRCEHLNPIRRRADVQHNHTEKEAPRWCSVHAPSFHIQLGTI